MAFSIDIGYTTDNITKVNKSVSWLTGEGGVSIHPQSVITQLNPVFIIDYNSAYLTANYVKATFLNRSYNATVSIDTAGRMILTCNVDVLAYDFSNCKITVTRNENVGINDIPDNKLPVLPNEVDTKYITVDNDKINSSANLSTSKSYVLCVISGGVSYGS